jgi:glycosyltransferase involved in cell wall biosynthesis
MNRTVIALLGRKDDPTDAVEEYCLYLSDALKPHDFQLEIRRVPWDTHGWPAALNGVRLMASKWRNTWVLVQYTALAWSARGFPRKVLRSLKIIKTAGARIGIVFHDVEPYPGARLVDFFRRAAQLRAMRRMLALSDLAVFTVPPEKISWLASIPASAAFIPVGPNLPIPSTPSAPSGENNCLTIGVFSITGGEPGASETRIILSAVRHAAQTLGTVRLSVFGRHAELRETELREGLCDVPVQLSVEGVVEPEQVVRRLRACDILLFVRGNISSRRSSAIAGIACGLPIIALSGPETSPPLSDAGVLLVPPDQIQDLNTALVRVLSDPAYRADLASRSHAAYHAHFAWPAIAARFASVLNRKS